MKEISTNFTRSEIVESTHKIKVLITDHNGNKIFSTNNENDYIYPRSAIKIFQAIPFVFSNAPYLYDLNPKKIALSCSSHRGEYFHIKELESWVKKIKVNKKILRCGIHNPLDLKASENLFRLNKSANVLHNNCAGKHLAMITSCLINKFNTKKYLNFNHPHQKMIRKVFEDFNNKKISKKNYGIDGCSAPQYAFRIKDIAKMLCNLIKSYNGNYKYSEEVKLLINSVIKHPKYIGGTNSFDSNVMSILNKKIFCKGGAEGVFLFADLKNSIAGVIKVVDGNERAIPSVLYELFKKLKMINNLELKKFEKLVELKLINHAKIIIGSTKTII